jgi:hypothetical protein
MNWCRWTTEKKFNNIELNWSRFNITFFLWMSLHFFLYTHQNNLEILIPKKQRWWWRLGRDRLISMKHKRARNKLFPSLLFSLLLQEHEHRGVERRKNHFAESWLKFANFSLISLPVSFDSITSLLHARERFIKFAGIFCCLFESEFLCVT